MHEREKSMYEKRLNQRRGSLVIGMVMLITLLPAALQATDLAEIRQRGVLRHLGIPYAVFVQENNGTAEGLDVALMQLFAKHLGVRYQ